MPEKVDGLDRFGYFVLTLHDLMGHVATARYLGQDIGDESQCIACRYSNGDKGVTKQMVIDQVMGNA